MELYCHLFYLPDRKFCIKIVELGYILPMALLAFKMDITHLVFSDSNIRACLPFVFAIKITKNCTFFKEKAKFDSRSIKRAFDFEPQDLAIFHAKMISLFLKYFYIVNIVIKGQARPIKFLGFYIKFLLSKSSNIRLIDTPPVYPPSVPSDAITR